MTNDKKIKLKINGKSVEVDKGTTILEAAKTLDIYIPTLCYHPLLEPYAACRVCVVEVQEKGRSNLVTSCNNKVREGMEVQTDSETAVKARTLNVEMLMAQAPAAEVVQEIARKMGIEKTRFGISDPNEKCILCGLCVRACQEIIGKSAISLVNRGIYKEVAAPFYAYELSGDCIGCGDCAFVCPTGAIEMGEDGRPNLPKVRIPYAEIEAMMKKESLATS